MNRYPAIEDAPYPAVATHMPVMWTVLQEFKPSMVWEFGSGYYSTSLLGTWTGDIGVRLISCENDKRWAPRKYHVGHIVIPHDDESIAAVTHADGQSLAFVDCEGPLRAGAIHAAFDAEHVGMLIAHDTEAIMNKAYGMRAPLMRWPYGMVVRCPWHAIETTVVSRQPMSDDLVRRLKSLTHDYAAHRLRWSLSQIFIRTHDNSEHRR